MTKKMTAFRLDKKTIEQLKQLANMVEYSSQAHVIEVAVDKLYRQAKKS